ncbi:MAG: glycerate kinase [Legionellales bacterium]|nr:glycerate kinase [Legionellales bacterium]|tara:strand:+ start:3834 stop:4985 length:1152 start_codon:yes stop_codon:yes gene_type:complete
MKIILAPDSFKGNLTSLEVAIAFEKGIKRVLPRANCIKIPMADGGEGTVQSLIDGIGGEIIRKRVIGPIGQKVFARYGLLSNGTAVIEMAEASGLPLVTTRQKNPTKTTTFGTGELIIDAINKGAKKIIIGIGGSATNDGGVGMAQALGVRFLDSKDKEIKQHGSGGMLKKIVKIDTREANKVLKNINIIVACDVDSPLCGRLGASYIFGPQKGATPAMVRVLDDNLKHLAKIIKQSLKKDISKLKGAGAAGGLGAGLVAFAKAKMKSGVDIVIDATNLERHMKNTNLVITGEGRVDSQTAYGKTPSGVAKSARKHGIPTLVIGGGITDDAKDIFSHGIDALESACARDMSLEDAIKHSREHLANAAERAIRLVLVGKKITKK